MVNRFRWTSEKDALLTRLWQQGMTSPEISERMGRSRSAILGRVRRLGIGRKELVSKSSTGDFSTRASSR